MNPQTPNPNPFVVQEAASGGYVTQTGFYQAVFGGLEDAEINGEIRWRWKWTVASGPEQGKVASALTQRSIRLGTAPARLVEGLLGRKPNPGENLEASIKACEGKSYLVSVAPGPKGGKPQVQSCGLPR